MMTPLRSKWAAGKARGGRISESIRNRRATRPPAHFQRNPVGRGRLAVFPRCSLDPYQFRYGRFARALKNSQLNCGDVTIICETAHQRATPKASREISTLKPRREQLRLGQLLLLSILESKTT